MGLDSSCFLLFEQVFPAVARAIGGVDQRREELIGSRLANAKASYGAREYVFKRSSIYEELVKECMLCESFVATCASGWSLRE